MNILILLGRDDITREWCYVGTADRHTDRACRILICRESIVYYLNIVFLYYLCFKASLSRITLKWFPNLFNREQLSAGTVLVSDETVAVEGDSTGHE